MIELYLHKVRKEAHSRLQRIVSDLSESEKLVAGKACVYATGSFGRLEAGALSDLDLFIIVDTFSEGDRTGKVMLDGIGEIKLKYDLIRVADENDVAKFDRGGRFLASHTIGSYTEWLGSNEDDYRNTLTGRMLMLLESQPLVGQEVYKKTIDQVILKYFRDYKGHENSFVPSFLFNDILRMWRTFCVNYEFYRKEGDSRNKIKNLKLKFSRMLTCYSGIIYLLAVYSKQSTLRPNDIELMIAISPTERLEAIAADDFWNGMEASPMIKKTVDDALTGYSQFLELTHQEVKQASKEYSANEAEWRQKSYEFGQHLFKLIELLGEISVEAGRLRKLITI